MEIKKKLPLFIFFIIAVPVVVISSVIYFFNSRTLLNQNMSEMSLNSRLVSNHVEDIIKTQQDEARVLARTKEIVDACKVRQNNPGEGFFINYSYEKIPANTILKTRFNELENHENFLLLGTDGVAFASSNPDSLELSFNSRDYFKKALSGKETISDTLISTTTKKPIVVFAAPVEDENNKVIGVAVNSVYTDFFTKSLGQVKLGQTGYAYMVDSQGTMISHPDKNKILKPVENDEIKKVADKIKNGQSVENGIGKYIYKGVEKLSGYVIIPGSRWILVLTQDIPEINKSTRSILWINTVIGIITILGALLIGLRFSKGITEPLLKISNLMKSASEGDTTVRCDISTKDEIGALSESFNKMTQNLSDIIKNVKDNASSVESQSSNLSAASQEIAASSQNVAKSVNDMAKGTESQAQDLSAMNSTLSNFAGEIEKIVQSIKEVDTNVKDIDSMASKSNGKMGDVKDSVSMVSSSFGDFLQKINDLSEGTKKINDIITVIDEIADQTSLLALNASIESVRAGESGRGFAVVADEIGKLAVQSKDSSKSIGDLIGGISGNTEVLVESASLMDDELKNQMNGIMTAIETFANITKAVGTVSPKVEGINDSASKIDSEKDFILSKIESASSVAQEISAATQEISATSEEVNASSEEVASSAVNLSGATEKMGKSVEKFKV